MMNHCAINQSGTDSAAASGHLRCLYEARLLGAFGTGAGGAPPRGCSSVYSRAERASSYVTSAGASAASAGWAGSSTADIPSCSGSGRTGPANGVVRADRAASLLILRSSRLLNFVSLSSESDVLSTCPVRYTRSRPCTPETTALSRV